MAEYQPQRYAQEGGLASGYTALVSPWASFIDVEPRQWQRLYDWLLPPYRPNLDLFVLHDRGQLLTVNPVYARTKLNIPDQIADPVELAKMLHAQWQHGTVVILERNQYQDWLDDIQREMWIPGDDLLAYGLKLKDCALRYAAEGIVLHPSPLSVWQNITPDFLRRLGHALAPDNERRGVVLVIYDGAEVWTSLVLAVQEGQVRFVTTLPADATAVPSGNWREDPARIVPIVETLIGSFTLGIFCERQTFESLGLSPAHWPGWMNAYERGAIITIPVPLNVFKISV